MDSLQGNILKCLLVASCLTALATASSPPLCCASDGALAKIESDNGDSSIFCRDNSTMNLSLRCTSGYYAFNRSEEPGTSYHVNSTDDGTHWLYFVTSEDGVNVTYNGTDRFCMNSWENATRHQEADDVLLVCFDDEPAEINWRHLVFGALSMLSSVFLALTLVVYLILPEMRELQDKAMMSVAASFMVAFFCMGNQNLDATTNLSDLFCQAIAFVMYYAYMSAFFWLNIISFNIWRSVWFPSFKLRTDVMYVIHCMIGWGVPLCFLAVALVTHNIENSFLRPGFGEMSCWFDRALSTWLYFYGPIIVLLSLNLIYLALTSWKLWMHYRHLDSCKLKVLRFKCAMYMKLALTMGFTWIFEVISYALQAESGKIYWIIPDLVNVLQGVIMFFILVVSRKRVRKLLAKRRPCNIPFPKSWAAYADEENCDLNGPEELELSNG